MYEKGKIEKEINTVKRKIELTKEDIDDKFNNSVLKEENIENAESTSQRITNFTEKWKNINNKYLIEIHNFKSDTSNLKINNKINDFNINKDLNYKAKTNLNINKIFNININDAEINQKENNDCKTDDEDHKSFNSSQYSESLEEEIELEQELDEKYSIKKINSPRCLSYDNSNTENSKNESDNEDEPEEFILDINEEPDFMFTNVCERGSH